MQKNFNIRKMQKEDREDILQMMKIFYSSNAVFTNGSDEIFKNDFENCINESPYLEGYVFYNDKELQGYAMIAKSFSTEFGKACYWLEDLYVKADYRGLGIGTAFLKYIENSYPDVIFRLEVEEENERAVHVYKKCGFTTLPYVEMKK